MAQKVFVVTITDEDGPCEPRVLGVYANEEEAFELFISIVLGETEESSEQSVREVLEEVREAFQFMPLQSYHIGSTVFTIQASDLMVSRPNRG